MSTACEAPPHEGRADRRPPSRRDGRARDARTGAGRGVDPRGCGGDLRDRPTAREDGDAGTEDPWARGRRRSPGRDGGRRAAERGLRSVHVVRARTGEPLPRPRGHRDPARRRSRRVDRRARAPRGAARRLPVRPRALDRTARLLPPRRGDARRDERRGRRRRGRRHARDHRDVGAPGDGRAGGGRPTIRGSAPTRGRARRGRGARARGRRRSGARIASGGGARDRPRASRPCRGPSNTSTSGVGSMRSPAPATAPPSTPTSCTTDTSGWWGARARPSTTTDARAIWPVQDRSRSNDCRRERSRSTRSRRSCWTPAPTLGR